MKDPLIISSTTGPDEAHYSLKNRKNEVIGKTNSPPSSPKNIIPPTKQTKKQLSQKTNSKTTATKKESIGFLSARFNNNKTFINCVGVFMFVYYLSMMYVRYQHRGIIGFADTLWLCNLAVVCGILSIFFNRPYLMGLAVNSTFIVHLMWVIDVVVYFTSGSFPLGNAEYISWPNITWGEIITTTHHAWFIPLSMCCLHRNGGYPKKSWIGAMLLIIPVTYLSQLFPKTIQISETETFYLNINMSLEFWKDMSGYPFNLIPTERTQYYQFLFVMACVMFTVSHNIMKFIGFISIKKQ
ncbi:hypothetical protein DICPUDRAFT_37008 [Dictyostelium purpureum]|uniref:Uncharacterized protein n=1 Tax=Dictyostelium purpureum TaxID=5786 RepID=F0ZS26_DICPU|nr:uncharacterized protein DICPUDRAFT_37008 [Dictyostelium purpureum]EGC33265.1 hypothetical protein DICPUDRAFT_37008 [Dictyostelium purpureum]|eukprot:XP_003290212.1 hypothetical protein DICPUDRAFT_37008 [Dictyostelium purpureum]